MSNTKKNWPKPEALERPLTLETAIEIVMGSAVGDKVVDVLLVVDVIDGRLDGVVLDAAIPHGGYVDGQELANSQVYLVLGLGQIETQRKAGIHSVDV